jgi:hypothetical protein
MRLVALGILTVLPSVAQVADTPLTELTAILSPMRAHPNEPLEMRGATAQFTTVKHRIRDWIEAAKRLPEWRTN